jgi:hypothetical protein
LMLQNVLSVKKAGSSGSTFCILHDATALPLNRYDQ